MLGLPKISSLKKNYNRAILLSSLRKYAPVSRTRLKEVTGIRMASITELIKELTEEGFVREVGFNESQRGRKQILLQLNPSNGYVVGVEFEAGYAFAILVDLDATIITRTKVRFQTGLTRDAIIDRIVQVISEVLTTAAIDRKKVLGIGIADPGLVDSQNGISLFSTTIRDWRDVPLRQILEKKFSLPVYLDESTRAKTLCEKRFGAGRDTDSMMFIEFGEGIGCGLINHGEIYRGFTETAGELGHMRVMEDGPVCNCGSYGCLETVASLPAISLAAVRAIKAGASSLILELAGGDIENITAEHVFEAARADDKLALSVIDKAAGYLGIGVANAVNLFNPETVIFDTRLAQIGELFLDPIKKMIKRQALEISTRRLKMEVSRLGEESGALGAATIVLDKVFEIPQLKIPEYL